MKIAVKPDLKLKTLCSIKSHIQPRDKQISFIDFKFYQKLFVVLMSLSTILIFPESPRELENICDSYNSKKVCSVW
jgi:hypothetical protein